jgi:hypothetical protein
MNGQHRWIRFSLLLVIVVSVLGTGFVAGTPSGFGAGTAAAQTDTQSQNQTAPTVEIDSTNNTTAETIVVSKARLPEGGFVAIHSEAYTRGIFHGSEISVSQYLSAGTHRNIEIPVNRSIPGANNVSRLNATRTNLSAVVYRDTNDNQQFDFSTSFGSTDEYYQASQSEAVSDTELVALGDNIRTARQRSQAAPASLQFTDQQLQRSNGSTTLTIEQVTLSEGGFIGVHDQRYLPPTNDPLNSTVGLSRYLSPGTHRNVTVELPRGSVTQNQTLLAIPYLDTDGDRTYDYVESGGEVDYAYIARQSGSTTVINETAEIRVPESLRSTQTAQTTVAPGTQTTTAVSATAERRSGDIVVATDAATDTTAESTTETTAQSRGGATGGIIASNSSMFIIGGIIVAITAIAIIWGFERRF